MTFKIMSPLLVLSFTFLSNFSVLGMDEKSASSKNVKLKRLLLSKENLPSFNEEFLDLRKQTIKKTKKSKKVQKIKNLKENELAKSFDDLGFHVISNNDLAKKCQIMGVKFILKSDMTQKRLEQERKEALDDMDPQFNERLKTLWN